MGYTIGSISARVASSANPVTASITVDPGTTVLVVMLVATGGTNRAGGSPTWGTSTLLPAGTTRKDAASPEVSAELWYVLNPTPGTQTLTIPNTGAISIRYHVARAACVSGGKSSFLGPAGANNTSTNPTATVPVGEDNAILFAVVGSGATTWAPSARTGVQISDTDAGANGDGFQYKINTAAGDQPMGWTFATSDDWGLCAAAFGEIQPVRMQNYLGVKVGDGMGTGEKIR